MNSSQAGSLPRDGSSHQVDDELDAAFLAQLKQEVREHRQLQRGCTEEAPRRRKRRRVPLEPPAKRTRSASQAAEPVASTAATAGGASSDAVPEPACPSSAGQLPQKNLTKEYYVSLLKPSAQTLPPPVAEPAASTGHAQALQVLEHHLQKLGIGSISSMLTNSAKEAVLRAAAVLPALLKAAGGLRSQVRLAQHRLLLAAAVQHMDHAAAESLAAVFSDERHAHPVRQESIEQQPQARGVQPSAAQGNWSHGGGGAGTSQPQTTRRPTGPPAPNMCNEYYTSLLMDATPAIAEQENPDPSMEACMQKLGQLDTSVLAELCGCDGGTLLALEVALNSVAAITVQLDAAASVATHRLMLAQAAQQLTDAAAASLASAFESGQLFSSDGHVLFQRKNVDLLVDVQTCDLCGVDRSSIKQPRRKQLYHGNATYKVICYMCKKQWSRYKQLPLWRKGSIGPDASAADVAAAVMQYVRQLQQAGLITPPYDDIVRHIERKGGQHFLCIWLGELQRRLLVKPGTDEIKLASFAEAHVPSSGQYSSKHARGSSETGAAGGEGTSFAAADGAGPSGSRQTAGSGQAAAVAPGGAGAASSGVKGKRRSSKFVQVAPPEGYVRAFAATNAKGDSSLAAVAAALGGAVESFRWFGARIPRAADTSVVAQTQKIITIAVGSLEAADRAWVMQLAADTPAAHSGTRKNRQ